MACCKNLLHCMGLLDLVEGISNSSLLSACYIISISDSIIKYHIEVYTNKAVTICVNLMLFNIDLL